MRLGRAGCLLGIGLDDVRHLASGLGQGANELAGGCVEHPQQASAHDGQRRHIRQGFHVTHADGPAAQVAAFQLEDFFFLGGLDKDFCQGGYIIECKASFRTA